MIDGLDSRGSVISPAADRRPPAEHSGAAGTGPSPGWQSPSARAVPVTVCVINHDGERYLEGSVGSALAATGSSVAEILLVDDASTDGGPALVRERFPSVRIVALSENAGPAAARNAALREARTDRILLLDNDVTLAPGCLERLEEALDRDPDAAVAMPSVVFADRPNVVQYDGAECHFLGLQILLGEERPLAASAPPPGRIGSLISACFLVDRSRLPDGFAFDDSFFIYFEDHDFGVRTRLIGRQVLSVPGAVCFHGQGTAGLSIRLLGSYSERRVFCLVRNRWQFLLKNFSLRTLLLLSPLLAVYEAAQLAIVVRKGWLRPWTRAAWWMTRHPVALLRKRAEVQASRRIPDRELLVGGPIPFRRELATGPLDRMAKGILDRFAATYWGAVRRLV